MEVNIRQAKATLSHLADLAFRGEEVIVTVRGKGKVQLMPEPENGPMGGFGMYAERAGRVPEWNQERDDQEDQGFTSLFEGKGE